MGPGGRGDEKGHEAGWYYFGANGKAYRGTTSSFKRSVDGRSYIFDESGRMLTGWFDEEGNPLDEDENPLEEGMYYADEDGALKTEKLAGLFAAGVKRSG